MLKSSEKLKSCRVEELKCSSSALVGRRAEKESRSAVVNRVVRKDIWCKKLLQIRLVDPSAAAPRCLTLHSGTKVI